MCEEKVLKNPSGGGGHDWGYGPHVFRYGWGLDGMGTPMEPSCIEHTTMHDHMNRRKIFGKPANGRMVGYVTRMQKRRPPYFSMKCLPCRGNFPKYFFRWCMFPLMFSRIEMCFFFMYRQVFLKDFVGVDISSFKSFSEWTFSR